MFFFSTEDFTMNLYHKALLCWSFQRDFDLSKIDSWIGTCRFHNHGLSKAASTSSTSSQDFCTGWLCKL